MDAAITVVFGLFALGIVMVIKGGDLFTDGAVWVAKYTGIPQVVVGATIVSLATTIPELIVAITAALTGHPDMAVGNAIGSANVNIGIILSIALIISSLKVSKSFQINSMIMFVTGLVFFVLLHDATVTRLNAIILLIILIIYFIYNYQQAINSNSSKAKRTEKDNNLKQNLIKFSFGAILIVIGSRLLIDNGSKLAEFFGVPELIVALTLVAIGTSLPELVTAVTSALKGNPAIGIGNILGANFFNITLVFGGAALITPIPVSEQTIRVDAPVMLTLMLLTVLFTYRFKRLTTIHGICLGSIYLAYFIFLATTIMGG
ncbi:cation:H+ antiporter [Desulfitispora alkaliphila]|uniref:calcium/sodium antiporter n=1 Tax=Desulfitispora alkaliphila TaxID=622674 RepID=UPI003D1B88A0